MRLDSIVMIVLGVISIVFNLIYSRQANILVRLDVDEDGGGGKSIIARFNGLMIRRSVTITILTIVYVVAENIDKYWVVLMIQLVSLIVINILIAKSNEEYKGVIKIANKYFKATSTRVY